MGLAASLVGVVLCVVCGAQPVLEGGSSAGVTVRLAPDASVVDAGIVGAKLAERADASGDTVAALDLHLLAANWMMAYQLEPCATRALLGIAAPEDAARAVAITASANAQLAAGRKLLDALGADALPDDERWKRREQLEKLSAFAMAFASIWPDKTPTQEQRDTALRSAAFALADVLEDERADVAFGAQLWQAYLYDLRGRVERAKDLLPTVMEPFNLKPAGASFGLYARLLRCRLMADADGDGDGEFVVPLALLARLESRCGEWYEDETLREPARRAAALVRRQLVGAWASRLREAGKTERATWCEQAIKRIDEEYFASAEPSEVLRLRQAIPAIVDLSRAEEESKKGHEVALDETDAGPSSPDVGTPGIDSNGDLP